MSGVVRNEQPHDKQGRFDCSGQLHWFPGTGVGFPEAFSEAWLEGSLEDVDMRNNKVMEVVC